MPTLRGKNVRICIYDATATKYKVIGMSTGCTITLTNNTENQKHKDIVGLASMPVTTNKSWSVSVDSLDTADTAAMLTAIKAMQPMTLMWDETSTVNNQTREKATWARKGQAYLTDVNFTFDDRTVTSKRLQFSGTGALSPVGSSEATEVIPIGSFTKGEKVRLFLSSDGTTAPSSVVAAAQNLALHVSLSLENSTTKDTSGEWICQEPTELNYDISSTALVRSGDTITSQVGGKSFADLETLYEAGTPFLWKIANVGGDNNRTASSTIVSGSILITQLEQSSPVDQPSKYTMQAVGYGDYTVAA